MCFLFCFCCFSIHKINAGSKVKVNARRCNNDDDLLHLSFVFKFLLFSKASLEPSRKSMMEFFWENNKSLTIFTKLNHTCSRGFYLETLPIFYLFHFR